MNRPARPGAVSALVIASFVLISVGGWLGPGPALGAHPAAPPALGPAPRPASVALQVAWTLCPGNDALLAGSHPEGCASTSSPALWSALFDPANGDVYISAQDPNEVVVVSAATNRVVATLPVDGLPGEATYEPGDGIVVVPDQGGGSLALISGATNTFAGNMTGLSEPLAVAFDAANGDLYVTDYFSATVTAVDGSTGTPIATIPVGIEPYGIVYDPTNQLLYATNQVSKNVSVISGTTNRVVATIPVGATVEGIGYDPANRELYVMDRGSENVSVISGATNRIVANISVTAPNEPAFDPRDGEVFVTTDSGDGDLVALSDSTNALLGSVFIGANQLGAAYDPTNGELFVTDEYDTAVSILAPSAVYPVAFTETGLPAGTSWSVTVGGVATATTTSTVAFTEPNGTFNYTVAAVPGYLADPAAGTVTVSGAAVQEPVGFSLPSAARFAVTFDETGLPSDSSWSVDLDGNESSSVGSAIIFEEPNGTYTYTVSGPSGDSATPSSGSVHVAGRAPVAVEVSLAKAPGPAPSSPSGPYGTAYVVAGIAAAVVVLLAVLVLWRRRRASATAPARDPAP
jgi:YVTN family beta-propeller protein